ncbi:MAG: tRNA 4-thiouridine(8) synthase ThiI [Deltaproteobacteria bacterium]|jgi:tRNA U34 2-thiouridine synthase MnmA/TrmU|nr:tRNA 4-thiouridine(8) synthase ThiI [Deltaproteobacteria bacterium]
MKAICVFSGGLDSMMAADLIRAQGIDVLALFFETPFFKSGKARKSARAIEVPFKVADITRRHLEVVKQPKHGYGGNMNPCIDCHALMFRIAGEMLEEEKAGFVFSGEVLGQRPMSQNRKSLDLVAAESGLNGLLLRPLSAKLLAPTIPEEKGWVQREQLLDFQGRSRKPQMEMAQRKGITEYPTPAGGCLLTEKGFSRRLKDLLTSKVDVETGELELLKLGRHFRIAPHTKIVVGRNKRENETIRSLAGENDTVLRSVSVPGPTVLVSGKLSENTLDIAGAITVAYSDAGGLDASEVRIKEGAHESRVVFVKTRDKVEFRRYMI